MFLIDYVTNDLLTTTVYGRKGGRFFRAHIQSFLPPDHPNVQFLDTERGYVGIQITTLPTPYILESKQFQYYGQHKQFIPSHHEMSLLTYFMMVCMLESMMS